MAIRFTLNFIKCAPTLKLRVRELCSRRRARVCIASQVFTCFCFAFDIRIVISYRLYTVTGNCFRSKFENILVTHGIARFLPRSATNMILPRDTTLPILRSYMPLIKHTRIFSVREIRNAQEYRKSRVSTLTISQHR